MPSFKKHPTLLELIKMQVPLVVKYAYCLELPSKDNDITTEHPSRGCFDLHKVDPSQKFHSDMWMKEVNCSLSEAQPNGKRIIHIRDFLFMNAMIYAEYENLVLRLNEIDGYIHIQISSTEFWKMKKAIKA